MSERTTADSYKMVDAPDLREMCAFKDGTIDILQHALRNANLALAKLEPRREYLNPDWPQQDRTLDVDANGNEIPRY